MALPDGHVDRGLVVPCSPLPSPPLSFYRYNQETCLYDQRPCDIMLFFGPNGLIYRYGMKITGSREDGERRGEGKREGRKNDRQTEGG